MANRIAEAIARREAKIAEVGSSPEGKVKLSGLDKSMATGFSDLVEYQGIQSWAFASGLLNLDEAQQVYRLLGGECPTPECWDKLSLATRVVLTQLMSELLAKKLRW